eukprot:3170202-Prorocentrum_lima.AAC.1
MTSSLVGSEMCIRDSIIPDNDQEVATPRSRLLGAYTIRGCGITKATFGCLLYTSDAADDM